MSLQDNTLIANNEQQEKKSPNIIRVKHDADNPFVMLNRQAMRDPGLSLEAVGLWARLLSNKDEWQIHVTQLMKVNNCGRDKIYRILKELITHGYAYHAIERSKGKYQMGIWYVFESKKSAEEIQKMFPFTENPYTVNPNTENPPLRNNIDKKNIDKKEEEYTPPKGVAISPISSTTLSDPPKPSGADDLCAFLFKKIQENKPDFSGKITPKWRKAAEKLLQLRTPKEIATIIDFALKDEFWTAICLSPGKILKHLDSLEILLAKGSATPNAKSPTATMEENKEFIQKIEKMFPKEISKCSIRIGYNYIEFDYGPMTNEQIKISEKGFKERVLCNLRKLNLPVHELKE